MMEILHGDITTKVPFIAVDETDPTIFLTGLSSFTVYRSRNGSAPVLMTTPTITEPDAVNMPGEYWLLLDEDTSLEAGVYMHSMTLRVAHTGALIAPILVTIKNNLVTNIENIQGRLPAALDQGFLQASVKRVGNTTLGPSGGGGQKYGSSL